MKIIFTKKCLEYCQPGHPESPERVKLTYEFLKLKLKQKRFQFLEPQPCSEEDILKAHTPRLLKEVKEGKIFEPDTPNLPNMFEYARLSAGAAIEACLVSLKGQKAFSLMRPPGHHASRDELGGFCYFNNIAIAVMQARSLVRKIAVVDFDCHHGNGTEDILLGKEDILYISLHQSPLYPGTGLKSRQNCLNYPLSPYTSPDIYLSTFEKALGKVVEFNPDLVAVSAGFDTYKNDPLTNSSLEIASFKRIGELLSDLNRPLFAVLEGGYSQDLPECIYQFLIGLNS